MKNIYSSDYWKTVREDEQERGNTMWGLAANPYESGVVPRPAYSSMFGPGPGESDAVGGAVSSLTGQVIGPEEFTHNNMQPYFRGTARQNMAPELNESRLETYTGRGGVLQNKQEVECFFEPTKDLTSICGMASQTDFYTQRITTPKLRNNDFPIDQVRVGPGLNAGYTSKPVGGFHQGNTLDIIRPKSIDELRATSRPKLVNEGRATGAPKAVITARGMSAEVKKNKPDTYWEQTTDQWFKTTGAYKKPREQPVIDLKPTSRVDGAVEYTGSAGPGARSGKGTSDDYGKASVSVYDNERDSTQTRTVITNVQSIVKAIVMPFLDIMRHNTKEYTIDAPREYGNLQAQIPSKPTVYDPINHIMRTTIKETTIHDSVILNAQGNKKGHTGETEAAKPTVRETLPLMDTTRNLSSHTYRVVIYNPDEVAKTTMRELVTPASNPTGYVGGEIQRRHGAYKTIKVQVPLTQKQFTATVSEYGIAGSKSEFRERSRAAEENAEIDGTREMLNIATGRTPNSAKTITTLDASQVSAQSRKLVQDSMSARGSGNVGHIYQLPPTSCNTGATTKLSNIIPNAIADRLDPAMLNSLKSNPYNLSINPIGA